MKKLAIIVIAVAAIAGISIFAFNYNKPEKQAERLVSQAFKSVESGDTENAKKLYLDAVEKDNNCVAAYDGLVDCYILEEDVQSLVDMSEKLNSDSLNSVKNKATTYIFERANKSLGDKDILESIRFAEILSTIGEDNTEIRSGITNLYSEQIKERLDGAKYEDALSILDEAKPYIGEDVYNAFSEQIPYAIQNSLKIVPTDDYQTEFAVGVGPQGQLEVYDEMPGISIEKTPFIWKAPIVVEDNVTDGKRTYTFRLFGSAETKITYDNLNWTFQVGYIEPLLIDYYTGLVFGGYERDNTGSGTLSKNYNFMRNNKDYTVIFSRKFGKSFQELERGDGFIHLLVYVVYEYSIESPEDYDGLLMEYSTKPRTDAAFINAINGVEGYDDSDINPVASEEEKNNQVWRYQFDSPDDAKDFVFMRLN